MTDDYLAISNTGKTITLTMTPGMKQRVLGRDDRIRMFYSCGGVHLIPSAPPEGYKLRERKNIWSVSMASARDPEWPIHKRAVRRWAHVQFGDDSAYVELPKPAVDMGSMLRNITEKLRRETPLSIHIDNPAINRPEPCRDEAAMTEPVMRDAEAVIDGEVFHMKLDERDGERIKAAWKRVNRARPVSEFHSANMALTGIASAFGGFTIAALLAAAGVLK